MTLKAIKALEELIGAALENLAAPAAWAAAEEQWMVIMVENMARCHLDLPLCWLLWLSP